MSKVGCYRQLYIFTILIIGFADFTKCHGSLAKEDLNLSESINPKSGSLVLKRESIQEEQQSQSSEVQVENYIKDFLKADLSGSDEDRKRIIIKIHQTHPIVRYLIDDSLSWKKREELAISFIHRDLVPVRRKLRKKYLNKLSQIENNHDDRKNLFKTLAKATSDQYKYWSDLFLKLIEANPDYSLSDEVIIFKILKHYSTKKDFGFLDVLMGSDSTYFRKNSRFDFILKEMQEFSLNNNQETEAKVARLNRTINAVDHLIHKEKTEYFRTVIKQYQLDLELMRTLIICKITSNPWLIEQIDYFYGCESSLSYGDLQLMICTLKDVREPHKQPLAAFLRTHQIENFLWVDTLKRVEPVEWPAALHELKTPYTVHILDLKFENKQDEKRDK